MFFLTPEGVKAYNRVGVESYKLSNCQYTDYLCQKYVKHKKCVFIADRTGHMLY